MLDVPGILNALSGYVWPALILFVSFKYYGPIKSLIERINRVSGTTGSKGVEIVIGPTEQLNMAAENVIAAGKQIQTILHQGKPYKNHTDAFAEAITLIDECLAGNQNNQPDEPLEIKFITISMTYSWDELIRDEIPTLLKKYGSARVKLDVVFVDHSHLKSLQLDRNDPNWEKVSEEKPAQFEGFAKDHGDFGGRLKFSARTYRNIPHWHGVLVNGEYLFLGRTNWEFPNGQPRLTIGQNKYRYYDNTDGAGDDGKERVRLFKNWHKYYFEIGWVNEFKIEGNTLKTVGNKALSSTNELSRKIFAKTVP